MLLQNACRAVHDADKGPNPQKTLSSREKLRFQARPNSLKIDKPEFRMDSAILSHDRDHP